MPTVPRVMSHFRITHYFLQEGPCIALRSSDMNFRFKRDPGQGLEISSQQLTVHSAVGIWALFPLVCGGCDG